MVTTIQVPSEYGYAIAAAVSTFFVGTWLGMRVGAFRKAAKIPYPYEYASAEQVSTASPAASKAMLAFNCAQRAHQNFNENHPTALAAMLVMGLRYPVAAGVMGGLWSVNRVVYGLGYTNGMEGGKGRYYGALWMFMHYGMIIMSAKVGYELVVA